MPYELLINVFSFIELSFKEMRDKMYITINLICVIFQMKPKSCLGRLIKLGHYVGLFQHGLPFKHLYRKHCVIKVSHENMFVYL